MTAPELKPCPFCGASASYNVTSDEGQQNDYDTVGCSACPAEMRIILHWADDDGKNKTDLLSAWNRRADLAAVQPAQVHNKIEAAAFSMWKAEADRAAPNVGKNRTPERFADASMEERDRWLCLAHAAMTALEPQPISKSADLHDPRDGVIARLVDAVHNCVGMLDQLVAESGRLVEWDAEDPFRMGEWFEPEDLAQIESARAALAAAKAVQHD